MTVTGIDVDERTGSPSGEPVVPRREEPRGSRRLRGETLVFVAATGVALLHALDDAFLNRQPGVPLGQHALAGLVSVVVALVAVATFPRLRPGVRAGIAFIFGVLATTNGVLHVVHIANEGPAASDVTGAFAAAAGIVLIGLALWIPFRHRGERAATARRRWTNRGIAVVVGFLLLYALVYPATMALIPTHKFREAIGEPPRGYEPVTFTASDGLGLSGWYAPSANGAAVILVHGGGGDRTGAVAHADLLRRHGYGVLLYDSRGRGESDGTPNAWGWGWERDVAGALQFLGARDDVERDRIGGLGLSTGADVLIEFAAQNRELRAVVGDGATARSFADQTAVFGLDAAAPYFWTMLAAGQVYSGESPGRPLEELVPEVAPTPLLLIAAGGFPTEIEFNRHYAAVAREPFTYWELPEAGHTAAIRDEAAEYERRVVGFFDGALGGGRAR